MKNILNLAHRGASARAPENSAAAFRLAMDLGANGVELDIHETADGRFIVHHDADIHGIEIARARLADLPPPSRGALPVPEFVEILDILADRGRAAVFVEIKGMRSWPDLRAILDPYRERLRLRVMSFDLEIMERIAADPGGHVLGVIARAPGPDPVALLDQFGASLLSLRQDAVTPALADLLHAAGRELHAWTVNDRARMRELADMKVDGLISDRPDIVKAVLLD